MRPGGGPPWAGRSGLQRNIRGSYAGDLVPNWMNRNGSFGSLNILQLKCSKQGETLPKDPFLISRCIETHLNGKIEGGFPEQGGITYGLKVRNARHVESLKNMKLLSDGLPNGIRVDITIDDHPTLNFSKCTVFCSDVNHYDDVRLLNELEDQNVTAIHRFTKSIDGRLPTLTGLMVLTIRGCTIPETVSFGFIRAKTKTYYPSPMMCYRCFAFGHTSKRCKSTDPICGRCSEGHSRPKEDPCTNPTFCIRCKSTTHALSSRKCPFYTAEETIQHIKIDNDLSYQDAKLIFEQENQLPNQQETTSFASVATDGGPPSQQQQSFDTVLNKLDQVLQDLKQKDQRIADLAEENKNLLTTIAGLQKTIEKQNQTIRNMANTGITGTTQPGLAPPPQTNNNALLPQVQKKIITKTELKRIQKQQRQEQQQQQRRMFNVSGEVVTSPTNKTQQSQQQPKKDQQLNPKEQRHQPKNNRTTPPETPDDPKRPKNDSLESPEFINIDALSENEADTAMEEL